jgi:hypothetical protein
MKPLPIVLKRILSERVVTAQPNYNLTSDKEEEEKLKIPTYVPGSAFNLVDLIGSSVETPTKAPTTAPIPAPSAQPKTAKQMALDILARRDIERDIRASLGKKGMTVTKRRDQTGRTEGKTPQYPEDLPRSSSSKGIPLKGPPRGPYLSPNFGSEGGEGGFKLVGSIEPPESFVQRTMKNPITTGAANLAWQMAVGYYPYKYTYELVQPQAGTLPAAFAGAAATIPAVAAVEATAPNVMKGVQKIVNRYNPKPSTEPSLKIQPKDPKDLARLQSQQAMKSGREWGQRFFGSMKRQAKDPLFWLAVGTSAAHLAGSEEMDKERSKYMGEWMAKRRAEESIKQSKGLPYLKTDEEIFNQPGVAYEWFGPHWKPWLQPMGSMGP